MSIHLFLEEIKGPKNGKKTLCKFVSLNFPKLFPQVHGNRPLVYRQGHLVSYMWFMTMHKETKMKNSEIVKRLVRDGIQWVGATGLQKCLVVWEMNRLEGKVVS